MNRPPGIKAPLAELCVTAMPGPPVASFMAQETEKYATLVRFARITAK
jgi:hypothetical protein